MNLHKIVKILSAVFGILGVLALFFILFKGDDAIKSQFRTDGNTSTINPIYIIGWIMFVASIILVLIFAIKAVLTGNVKKTLISIGLFLGVVLISFIVADGSDMVVGGVTYSGATSKLVSTGLNTFYFLALVAIGTMAWTGLTKIKK
jgi:hypothetical protein